MRVDTHIYAGYTIPSNYDSMIAKMIGSATTANIKELVASYLGISISAHALKAMEWLGLFDDKPRHMSLTPLVMDTPMPPWNMTVISRAKHELSPVCIAFLKQLRESALRRRAPP